MAFGMWGAVGPSNHVLDGVWIPPWYGAIWEDFLPIEKRWDCVLPNVQQAMRDTCRPLAKDAEVFQRVEFSGG